MWWRLEEGDLAVLQGAAKIRPWFMAWRFLVHIPPSLFGNGDILRVSQTKSFWAIAISFSYSCPPKGSNDSYEFGNTNFREQDIGHVIHGLKEKTYLMRSSMGTWDSLLAF